MPTQSPLPASARTVGWFALGGTIGPLLILVLPQYDSSLYHPLYTLISALCPAWLLGPLEYSYGFALTWVAICLANVVLWALLGAIVAVGRRADAGAIAFAVVSALAVGYAYWTSLSIPAILALMVVLSALYFISNARYRAADA